jgi:ATPase subunit of ABC transporter with duplicated ATPase domains
MIIMISHENQFLNNICNYIVSVYDKKLYLFKGNYDTYINARSKQEIVLIKVLKPSKKAGTYANFHR